MRQLFRDQELHIWGTVRSTVSANQIFSLDFDPWCLPRPDLVLS